MIGGIPALIKVLLIFTLVLVLNRLRLHLGLALILGTMAMGLWFGHGATGSLLIILRGVSDSECILLIVAIYHILTLTQLMSRTGQMQGMITSVRALAPSRRLALAILPAMLGFLSMPGGAAVSAPMVEAADEEKSLDPAQKTAINYWFRHAWEFWWPLYPGTLLAYEMSGLTAWQFATVQMPLSLFSLIFGAIFLLLPLRLGPRKARPTGKISNLVLSMFPIILLIGVWMVAGAITSRFTRSNYPPLLLGIWAAMIWVHFMGGADKKTWMDILKNKKTLLILVVVAGVKVFSRMLGTPVPGGEKIVDLVGRNLKTLHIPELLIVMLIPFISGIVTGLGVGFVGSSFPIVLSLAAKNPAVTHIMSYVVLGYGFGYIGMMLSPVHVCFVLSNEYFNTSIMRAYKKIWLPAMGILCAAGLLSYIASHFG